VDGVAEVELLHPVQGKLLPVPAVVAEKDDMWGREGEVAALVFGVEEPPTLELFGHAVEMATRLRCCPCDVEAHNLRRLLQCLCVESVGHVRYLPREAGR